MRSRKRLLKESRLYLLIDRKIIRPPVLPIVKKLKGSGVDIIQFRDKRSPNLRILREAVILSRALKKTRTLFIINDYLEIALLSGSDGLHLGQSDMPVKLARRILGKDKLIGVSCSNLKQALKAQSEGADYIGIGPVFKSATKPQAKAIGLKGIKGLDKIKIPVFAIGNINLNNLSKIIACGINRVAVTRAILKAKNITKAASCFSKVLKKV
ncbi:MAG: thiamine phosphate synthase [Candidatus Omnitrophica bacterium]|nr:thiamine phosphate synthase [Candidatus Omnitrophota bacterium]